MNDTNSNSHNDLTTPNPAQPILGLPREKIGIVFGSIGLLIVIIFVAIGIAKSGGNNTKPSSNFATPTYPFSFDYPAGWAVSKAAEFTYGSNDAERSVSIVYKSPLDQAAITQYQLNRVLLTDQNGNQKEVDKIVKRLTKQAGGTASDAAVVTYNGVPGYQYTVEYNIGATALRNELTFLFKGDKEYQVTCQSTPQNRTVVEAGCVQILNSFKIN